MTYVELSHLTPSELKMGTSASTQRSHKESQISSKLAPSAADTATTIFESKLAKPSLPGTMILYRVDGTDETLTLAKLEVKSRKFAVAVRNQFDIRPNDVVSIFARDKIQYPIAFFGALAAGATVALIPYQSGISPEDIASRLEQAHSKILVTDAALLRVSEMASVLVGCPPIVTLDKTDQHTASLEDLIRTAPSDQGIFEIHTHAEAETNHAFLNRTSGSTGTMKSVITSHSHYIATLEGTVETIPPGTDPSSDFWLASSSLGFFINAKLFMSLNVLLGIPVVIMPEPLDESNVSILTRHSITFTLVFPPLVAKLAKLDLDPQDVRTIKWPLSAGASIPENLHHAMSQKFPGVHLTLEWGTSETMLIAIQTSDPKTRRRGSSGTLVNGMQARVVSTETGADLSANQPGEILVRNSLARFCGYKNNDVANQDFNSQGWFHTGDYGYIDEDCNVYIVDRLKELLRVGDGYGSRISVSELENAVFEHPAVRSVVVVGIWNETTATHFPTAFIPTEQFKIHTGKVLAEEIEEFVGRKWKGLKRLSGGIYFIEHYPTTGFKINRRVLKEIKRDEDSRLVIREEESFLVGQTKTKEVVARKDSVHGC
ncbi:AMP-binding enzyme domain-containing protein [Clohesyomyces aquaticus]|uniref:AMP-binding enzyme domain-containing protein n=1 Tax=Clohesyomyces aquaticus TaxID=1231657 RepID=A0A1Y1ZKL7_9PLEO|nr:AMP-binding enzyme domain-containing protein [Clohesyomyces aquaticus]